MKRLSLVLLFIVAVFAPSRVFADTVVWKVVKASQIPGVMLDCVVNPNVANVGKTASGGTCTDNTAAINSAVQAYVTGGAGAIKLILDGGTATTGIIIPGTPYFEIEGIGRNSGVFMIAGSNSHAIYNNGKTGPFDQQTTPPAQAGYVSLKNFTINGNRGNGTTGNSTTGDPRGPGPANYFYDNIDLANLSAVRIEDMYSYDSPAYNIRLNNCADIVVENNTIWNPETTFTANGDGIHLDGPWNDARIVHNEIYNNFSDDGVALNAHEGYGGSAFRTVVSGNTYVATATAMRLYGSSGTVNAPVYSTVFSNNTGTVGIAAILLGADVTYSQDYAGQTTTASDNTFVINNGPFVLVEGNPGDLILSNCVWNAPSVSKPFIQGVFAGSTISNLTINNCRIYRNTSGSTTTTPLVSASAALTINRMTINDFQVVNEAGQSYSAVASLLAMTNVTISNLYVAALNYTNITNLADSFTGITALAGAYANKQVIAAAKTGAYTAVPTDAYLRADATTAAFTITLPAAPYLYEEHEIFKVDSVSANAVTIAGNGKTINGNASLTTQNSHAKFRYNGTSWDSL